MLPFLAVGVLLAYLATRQSKAAVSITPPLERKIPVGPGGPNRIVMKDGETWSILATMKRNMSARDWKGMADALRDSGPHIGFILRKFKNIDKRRFGYSLTVSGKEFIFMDLDSPDQPFEVTVVEKQKSPTVSGLY